MVTPPYGTPASAWTKAPSRIAPPVHLGAGFGIRLKKKPRTGNPTAGLSVFSFLFLCFFVLCVCVFVFVLVLVSVCILHVWVLMPTGVEHWFWICVHAEVVSVSRFGLWLSTSWPCNVFLAAWPRHRTMLMGPRARSRWTSAVAVPAAAFSPPGV